MDLQKLLNAKKIKWLTEVCFAVSLRLAAGDGGVMDEELERDEAEKMETSRQGMAWMRELTREKACKKVVWCRLMLRGDGTL